jgi:multiple sugar transport system permease protein/putative aldouronate transport system permease protein
VALVSSFSNENILIREGYRLWIKNFDLTSYRLIFSGTNDVMNAYLVTIGSTAGGVALTLLLTSSLAYPLSVPGLKYRNRIAFFAYFTMLFNGGLVPNYILTTRFLHMRNSIWVLIIPGALNAYNMFLMRNYFASIPQSLAESAKIDGATDIRIYRSIILPLAKPILATIGLFAAMGYWNEWYKVLLYIDNRKLFTLQYLIMRLQQQVDFLTSSLNPAARSSLGAIAVPTIGIRLATAMISIGPIVLLYPFLQKYFIKGIMVGSVKG